MKIFAVVVTYNRLALLKKVIDLLKRQTRQLDSIVIVNNGSTDGTKEWLEPVSYTHLTLPTICSV